MTWFGKFDEAGILKVAQYLANVAGPAFDFDVKSLREIEMTLSGFASKYAQLYIVTKGASLLQNTPRRDGDLLYNFSNYVIDDANYSNNDYDAYSTGMVVLKPPASGQKVTIYYKNPLNKTDGAPIWVSLRLSDNSLSPQNTLQTPYLSGDVNLTGANMLGISSDEQVVLSLPSEAPPPQEPPRMPYYLLDDSHSYHISFTNVPGAGYVIAFTDPPTAGRFYFFFLFTSSDPSQLVLTHNLHDAPQVSSGSVGTNSTGNIHRIYGYCNYAALDSTKQFVIKPNIQGTVTSPYVWTYY